MGMIRLNNQGESCVIVNGSLKPIKEIQAENQMRDLLEKIDKKKMISKTSDMKQEQLIKEEKELFNKIGFFAVGLPSFEQAKMMDEFMETHCKFYDNKSEYYPICKLAHEKCVSLPSECIYRKVYAKAADDIKKKLENDDF